MMPDIKLSFKEFVETYKSDKTIASTWDLIPLVDNGQLHELRSYELLLNDDENDTTITAGHPDYMEAGIEAYEDFLLDMQIAFYEKRPS